MVEPSIAAEWLVDRFFLRSEPEALWQTALLLENLNVAWLPGRLLQALTDHNEYRRRAAVRILGWSPVRSRRARNAIAAILGDASQPLAVREEAAESLAYSGDRNCLEVLVSALAEPDVRIRFWSVFALGSIRDSRGRSPEPETVTPALEKMLLDTAIPDGNWWPVSHEALAALAQIAPAGRGYQKLVIDKLNAISDADSVSPEDRRWSEAYGFLATGPGI